MIAGIWCALVAVIVALACVWYHIPHLSARRQLLFPFGGNGNDPMRSVDYITRHPRLCRRRRSWFFKYSVLHIAAIAANCEAVKALLSIGCDPVVRDSRGRTPLHHASSPRDMYSAYLPVVIALLESGANPNTADSLGNTPLSLATKSGNSKMKRLMEEFIPDNEVHSRD